MILTRFSSIIVAMLLACTAFGAPIDTPYIQHFPHGNSHSIDSFKGSLAIDHDFILSKFSAPFGRYALSPRPGGWIDTVRVVTQDTVGNVTINGQLNASALLTTGIVITPLLFVNSTNITDLLAAKQDTLGFTPDFNFNIIDFGATPHFIDSTDDDTQPIQNTILASCGFTLLSRNTANDTVLIKRVLPLRPQSGVVSVPNGIYNIKGPLVKCVKQIQLAGDTIKCPVNAQLYIPYVADSNRGIINPFTIEFEGGSTPNLSMETPTLIVNRKNWTNGANLLSSIYHDGSSYPAIIASVKGDFVLNCCSPNIIFPIFNKMWFTSRFDSSLGGTQLCGIMLRDALDGIVKFSRIDANIDGFYLEKFKHTHDVVGVWLPNTGQGTVNGIPSTLITGYKFGAAIGEHANIDNAQFFINNWGVEQMPTFHETSYRTATFQWNIRQIGTGHLPYSVGDSALIYGDIHVERDCHNFEYDIDDSLNILRGKFTYYTRNLFSGCPGAATEGTIYMNGGTKINLSPIRVNSNTINGNIFIQDNAGNVGIGIGTPIFKLDVRSSSGPVGMLKYLGSNNVEILRLDGANGMNSLLTWYENGAIRWYAGEFGSDDHFGILDGVGVERINILTSKVTMGGITVDETTSNSKVGINITSPQYSLDVTSPNQVPMNLTSTFAGNAEYRFASASTRNVALVLYNGTSPLWYFVNVVSATNQLQISNNNGIGGIYITQSGGRVMVGTNTDDTKAIFNVNSTTQYALLPRMTTTQRNAITSPAAGAELYCTDCTATDASTGVKQVYNGSAWKNCW